MQAPLSAISFCADGHTIGVGTEQTGQVIIYDLKDSKRVKIELKGHDRSSRVKAIQFSRLLKTSSSNSNNAAAAGQQRPTSHAIAKTPQVAAASGNENMQGSGAASRQNTR